MKTAYFVQLHDVARNVVSYTVIDNLDFDRRGGILNVLITRTRETMEEAMAEVSRLAKERYRNVHIGNAATFVFQLRREEALKSVPEQLVHLARQIENKQRIRAGATSSVVSGPSDGQRRFAVRFSENRIYEGVFFATSGDSLKAGAYDVCEATETSSTIEDIEIIEEL